MLSNGLLVSHLFCSLFSTGVSYSSSSLEVPNWNMQEANKENQSDICGLDRWRALEFLVLNVTNFGNQAASWEGSL